LHVCTCHGLRQNRARHVGHARAIAGEAAGVVIGLAVESDRTAEGLTRIEPGNVGRELAVGYRAVEVRRMHGIRRSGDQLARTKDLEITHAAVRAHSNFHPAVRAREGARAEVERRREQPVAHGGGRVGDWPGHEAAVSNVVANRKS